MSLDIAAVSESKLFVVVGIPAYNEEKTIARVVLNAQRFSDVVLVCDDGSTDFTGEVAKRLGANVIRHERKLGYGAAIKTLFDRARDLEADVLVTLDGDQQHDANEIPNVLKPIKEKKADIVIASRFLNGGKKLDMPLYRRIGAEVISRIVNSSAKNGIRDSQSGFRAYNRRALETLDICETGMGASVEILLDASKHNLKICEVPGSCKYCEANVTTSSQHPVPQGIEVVTSIIRYVIERKPLVFLGIPGIACLFTGIAFGVWMLQIYAAAHLIVTNLALASLAFVVIGFFMLSTSITLYAISRLTQKMNGKRAGS